MALLLETNTDPCVGEGSQTGSNRKEMEYNEEPQRARDKQLAASWATHACTSASDHRGRRGGDERAKSGVGKGREGKRGGRERREDPERARGAAQRCSLCVCSSSSEQTVAQRTMLHLSHLPLETLVLADLARCELGRRHLDERAARGDARREHLVAARARRAPVRHALAALRARHLTGDGV